LDGQPPQPVDDSGRREALKKQRDTIAKFMEEGNGISKDCLLMGENPNLANSADDWAKRNYAFLGSVEASFAARFSAASGPTYTHNGVPASNDNIWNFINLREQVLSAILSELRD
jgi:hypothetical protein